MDQWGGVGVGAALAGGDISQSFITTAPGAANKLLPNFILLNSQTQTHTHTHTHTQPTM